MNGWERRERYGGKKRQGLAGFREKHKSAGDLALTWFCDRAVYEYENVMTWVATRLAIVRTLKMVVPLGL